MQCSKQKQKTQKCEYSLLNVTPFDLQGSRLSSSEQGEVLPTSLPELPIQGSLKTRISKTRILQLIKKRAQRVLLLNLLQLTPIGAIVVVTWPETQGTTFGTKETPKKAQHSRQSRNRKPTQRNISRSRRVPMGGLNPSPETGGSPATGPATWLAQPLQPFKRRFTRR